MGIIQVAEIVIGSIVSLGVLFAGTGYLWAQIFVGRNKANKDDFDLFNSQIDGLTKIIGEQTTQIKTLQEDIKQHTSEIGRLNGIIEEKDKKITDLLSIVQNRDPSLGEYIQFARDSILEFKDSVKRIHERVDLNDAKSDKIIDLLQKTI